ncbi:MAG TPA: hypothetical protein VJT72_09970, partial [Pseudonocardiaceae bacterium]|nr:hypothetical protein [Pseudonocardiaceae bacterium]
RVDPADPELAERLIQRRAGRGGPATAPDGSDEPTQTWRVGVLAELTGLTVRAVHHYDHLGRRHYR